jgi:RNA methyltransferase, TrmH family
MLTSLQNPLIKQLRKLNSAKQRREQQVYLLEGSNLLEAALDTDQLLDVVCYTEFWQQRHPKLHAQLQGVAQRLELVSPEVLGAIATTSAPDGVIATVPRQQRPLPKFRSLALGLEALQDPGNLGTILRTAAAVELDGLLLSPDGVDPENPKVLRASAGQWFRTPMQTVSDFAQAVQALKPQGFQVVATLPTASQTYWQADFSGPTLILLGNEGAGLSPQIAALADVTVTIPQSTAVESLNVGIAAALLLYEVKRQRSR